MGCHLGVVTALLRMDSIDINHRDEDGDTALTIAANNGHVEVVTALLRMDNININHASDSGATALFMACQNGHRDVVDDLLHAKGIDVNHTEDRCTPLWAAAGEGHTAIVAALLRAGAVVYRVADNGMTARENAENRRHHECALLLADAEVAWLKGVLEDCPTMQALPLDIVTL